MWTIGRTIYPDMRVALWYDFINNRFDFTNLREETAALTLTEQRDRDRRKKRMPYEPFPFLPVLTG